MDYDENIRVPDDVIIDKLVTNKNVFLTEEEEINMAIFQSIECCKEIQQQHYDYEDEILKNYHTTRCEREKMFEGLLFSLKKISKYDKKIEQLSDLLKDIINAYCLGYIEKYQVDEVTYNNIFQQLSSIRTDKIGIGHLQTILQIENIDEL
jgi:hypothetical protein